MAKVLVINSSNYLGRMITPESLGVDPGDMERVSVEDYSNVSKKYVINKLVALPRGSVIIYNAFNGTLDSCELSPQRALTDNCIWPIDVFKEVGSSDNKLIYISSSNLYKSDHKKIEEDGELALDSVANLSYFFSERTIRQHCQKYCILRLSPVFGLGDEGELDSIIQSGKRLVPVVRDILYTPVYIEDVLCALQTIVIGQGGNHDRETYNYGGPDEIDPVSFALMVINCFELDKKVAPVTRFDYTASGLWTIDRASRSCLNSSKIYRHYKFERPRYGIEDALLEIFGKYKEEQVNRR